MKFEIDRGLRFWEEIRKYSIYFIFLYNTGDYIPKLFFLKNIILQNLHILLLKKFTIPNIITNFILFERIFS